jgi:DNA-binding NarL/FixJ family response regulator
MKNINVLLFPDENLLTAGIRSMISNESDLNITILQAQTVKEFIEKAIQAQPEVIIVEHELLAQNSGLLNQLLKNLRDIRLITLDDTRNTLHVYTHRDISIQQASDLVTIIRSNTCSTPLADQENI